MSTAKRTNGTISSDTEIYVIGSEDIPYWAYAKIMPYRKMNGSIGYEFRGKFINMCLNAGDELIKCGNRIEIKRKDAQ